MNAMYFMGVHSGTSKKTNEPFYAVQILWLNSYGNYEIVQLYATADLFQKITGMGIARGTAVDICALGKSIASLEVSKRFRPLNLGEVAK